MVERRTVNPMVAGSMPAVTAKFQSLQRHFPVAPSRRPVLAVFYSEVGMAELTLKADFSLFKQKLAWMAGLLESLDTRKRLESSLLGRLVDATNGIGGEELCDCSRVTAGPANELIVRVDGGKIIRELESALRALGFEFHGVPVVD
jgi:hypothetical protein